jgi:hypothetical protein
MSQSVAIAGRDLRGTDWCALLGGAFLLRLFVAQVALGNMPLVSDARSYSLEGIALSTSFPGARAYFWPPGMPTLLAGVYALLGSDPWVSRLVGCSLGTLQVGLSTLLAREVLADLRGVRAAGWIAALYAPAVLMSGQPYSQLLAGVALTALALFAMRTWRTGRVSEGACAGVAWGVGCVTRPSMLSIVPVLLSLGAAVWWRRRANFGAPRGQLQRVAVAALVGVALAAAILTPVALHNLRYGAGATLSTNNEANFFVGNNPYTPHYKTSHLGQRELNEFDPATRAYLEHFRSASDPRVTMRDEALRYIREHPGISAWRTANRIRAFWGFDYLMARNIQLDQGLGTGWLVVLTAVEAGGYVLVMSLALVTLLCGTGELRRAPTWIAMACVAAYQAPYALAFSAGTHHFPVIGLLFPFAGLALARDPCREQPWLRARSSRTLWLALAILVGIQIEYGIQTLVWM